MGSGWASSCLRYDKSSKIKVSRYLQTACNPLVYRRINLQPHKRWQSRVKCDCINFIQRLEDMEQLEEALELIKGVVKRLEGLRKKEEGVQ